jgi:guanyl-specific ribonuclease Sa
MPIRDRITWGATNPFSDPRLGGLDEYVRGIRQGRLPRNVTGGSVFANVFKDLPVKPHGYYREYDVVPTVNGQNRGTLRIVLGESGEVYITGNHYRDFRQIIDMPA